MTQLQMFRIWYQFRCKNHEACCHCRYEWREAYVNIAAATEDSAKMKAEEYYNYKYGDYHLGKTTIKPFDMDAYVMV